MPTATETITLIDKTSAYWYACGYNDHRQQETGRDQPYVDAMEFANWWLVWTQKPSRPSLQEAFKVFKETPLGRGVA